MALFFHRNSKICYNSTKIRIVSIWVNRIQSNRLIVQKNVNWQFACWQFKYRNFVRQEKKNKKKNSYQLKWNSIELKHPAAELSWSNDTKLHLFPSNFSFSSTDFFQYLFRLNVHHPNCLCKTNRRLTYCECCTVVYKNNQLKLTSLFCFHHSSNPVDSFFFCVGRISQIFS